MLKYLIILFTLGSILLSGCGETEQRDRPSASSSGQPFELTIVYSGDTSIENAVKDALGRPFPALPQPESWFDLRFLEVDNLANMHKRYRNIIFVGSFERENEVNEIITDLFGEETVRETIDNPNRFYSSSRDVWASPQTVLALYAETTDQLTDNIRNHKDFLTQQLDEAETDRLRRDYLGQTRNSDFVNRLRGNHDLDLYIPKLFRTYEHFSADENEALNDLGIDNVVWMRGHTKNTDQEILVYYGDYVDKDQLDKESIIDLRDSIGKHFVPGPTEGSFMQTERRYPPESKEVNFNDKYAIETRGLWRVENDFMGGPFINYTIWDEGNQRLIHLDGFVYAPREEKRDFIKRMEVVLRSLSIPSEEAS